MSPFAAASEGLLLGLATGGQCVGFCLPALAPLVLAPHGGETPRPWRTVLAFLSGRLAGYLAVGAAAVALGVALDGMPWPRRVAGLAMLVLAGGMLVFAVQANFPEASICRRIRRWCAPSKMPWLFGLLIGVSPCPPLLLVCAALVQTGARLSAAFLAAGFLAATSLLLLSVGLLGHPRIAGRLSGAARAAAAIAAVWFAAQGVSLLG